MKGKTKKPNFSLMWQRLIAFLFLMVHLNGSMLLPQVDEVDLYHSGLPLDDINTIVEFFQQEVLNISDTTPEDEDDDQGQDLKIVRVSDDVYPQTVRIVSQLIISIEKISHYSDFIIEHTLAISYDIITPPPKSLA
jgi:hypothetical protein